MSFRIEFHSNNVLETQATCRNCRYNLTGLVHPRCPECGCGTAERIAAPSTLRSEHILLGIDVMSVVMGVFFLSALPHEPGLPNGGAYVGAMLAPLQCVLALAGGLVATHLGIGRCRKWTTGIGGILPVAVAIVCLIIAFR